jgi:hypothetical protein
LHSRDGTALVSGAPLVLVAGSRFAEKDIFQAGAFPAKHVVVHHDADDIRQQPVERKPAGNGKCKPAEHQRHHPEQRLVRLRLVLIRGRHAGLRHRQLLLNPHTGRNQHRQDVEGVGLPKIPQQEVIVDGHRLLNEAPRVQPLREIDHRFGGRTKNDADDVVERYPDWKLNQHRQEATSRAGARLFVQRHRFCGALFGIFDALRNLVELWLELRHFSL